MGKLAHVFLGEPGAALKFTEHDDGTVTVTGVVSSPRLDLDGQIADPDWLKDALPEWMTWGNVRTMHSATAAGVGKALDRGAGDKWTLRTHVIDSDAVRKVKAGVYKGYSIGIKGARVVTDPRAPKGRIVGGTIVEISLVDRPANPDSQLTVAKAAASGGRLGPVTSTHGLVAAEVAKVLAARDAELAALQGELTKLLKTPIPGGPMLVAPRSDYRTPVTLNKAAGPDKQSPAYWRALADKTTDQGVAAAYHAQARRLEAQR